MNKYDHADIEKKWQKKWEEQGLYATPDTVEGKENHLTLVEFSYPSGNLHVGHWYAFALPDIFARFKRMQGYNSLYPMGFDAFGLPAENAAIKLGKDPKKWTYEHMDTMRGQLRSMGAMFDWSREVVSCSPEYYKWTQWMFTQMFENDLAYRAQTTVNWCPKDKTILANEQVVDGVCERCGEQVEQRNQDQWMLRITKYADALVDDLENLNWPHAIKEAQRNWIGRTEGSEIDFSLESGEKVTVFTTRADTLFGVTYLVLAPEHSLVEQLAYTNTDEVAKYIAETKKKGELERKQSKEKTGVVLEGVVATHPLTGEKLPVWIADYVLVSYATGAVMAVPAHDERDYEFAEKFNLNKKPVVLPKEKCFLKDFIFNKRRIPAWDENKNLINAQNDNFYRLKQHLLAGEAAYLGKGSLVNSGDYDGLTPDVAREKITEAVGGTFKKTYRLRDWGISRQRYWGTPIPIVYDPEGVAHTVPSEHLPWLLPEDVDHTPDGTAPLARSKELFERTEKLFGKGWTPEVETMDTFVDSTWYFYRYLDPKNNEIFCSKENQKKWLPMNLYMGGAEHTTMHLLYSRFWTKALHSLGLVENVEEFQVRRNRGLILGPDGNKMSKSKGNVIDPDEVVSRLGADTVRLYLAFMGPYGVTENYPWDPNGVVGVRRFLERVWRIKEEYIVNETPREVSTALHKTIAKVGEDIEEYKFNTAIAAMMSFINVVEDHKKISHDDYNLLLRILAPFAPHMTEELWSEDTSIHLAKWPTYDADKLQSEIVTIAVQVNGKLRGTIEMSPTATEEEVREKALALPNVAEKITGEPKKVIYVAGRLINIVV